MKTPARFSRTGKVGACAFALIAALFLTSQSNAQYSPTGDDGITASPRFRQQLDERGARPAKPAEVAMMACPKCKDVLVIQPITDTKGSGARVLTGRTTKAVPKHLCEACNVAWKTEGTGKAKTAVAIHTCSASGSQSMACCAPKGSRTAATKGIGAVR